MPARVASAKHSGQAPAYDVNKNVSELVDASGNIAAHYEYSPFGKTTVASGPYANANPVRFSSEHFDSETALVYYNFRYYSPDLGRWLSKDPIEEEGGWNLYCMVRNNPITLWDLLGKECCPSAGDEDKKDEGELASPNWWQCLLLTFRLYAEIFAGQPETPLDNEFNSNTKRAPYETSKEPPKPQGPGKDPPKPKNSEVTKPKDKTIKPKKEIKPTKSRGKIPPYFDRMLGPLILFPMDIYNLPDINEIQPQDSEGLIQG